MTKFLKTSALIAFLLSSFYTIATDLDHPTIGKDSIKPKSLEDNAPNQANKLPAKPTPLKANKTERRGDKAGQEIMDQILSEMPNYK